jgi:hypothetical protein
MKPTGFWPLVGVTTIQDWVVTVTLESDCSAPTASVMDPRGVYAQIEKPAISLVYF